MQAIEIRELSPYLIRGCFGLCMRVQTGDGACFVFKNDQKMSELNNEVIKMGHWRCKGEQPGENKITCFKIDNNLIPKLDVVRKPRHSSSYKSLLSTLVYQDTYPNRLNVCSTDIIAFINKHKPIVPPTVAPPPKEETVDKKGLSFLEIIRAIGVPAQYVVQERPHMNLNYQGNPYAAHPYNPPPPIHQVDLNHLLEEQRLIQNEVIRIAHYRRQPYHVEPWDYQQYQQEYIPMERGEYMPPDRDEHI